MRLRRKPWIDEAIKEYTDILYLEEPTDQKGKWRSVFPHPENELHVEFGTGKGQFISGMAAIHPQVNFIGMEVQEGVIYYAAKKTAEKEPPLTNVRLILGDVSEILNIFGEGEVDVIYLNFSDPWPKARHSKRRLTSPGYLKAYQTILREGGTLEIKTDNRGLYEYTLETMESLGMEPDTQTEDLHGEGHPAAGFTTEYEDKFRKEGKGIYYIRWTRTSGASNS